MNIRYIAEVYSNLSKIELLLNKANDFNDTHLYLCLYVYALLGGGRFSHSVGRTLRVPERVEQIANAITQYVLQRIKTFATAKVLLFFDMCK